MAEVDWGMQRRMWGILSNNLLAIACSPLNPRAPRRSRVLMSWFHRTFPDRGGDPYLVCDSPTWLGVLVQGILRGFISLGNGYSTGSVLVQGILRGWIWIGNCCGTGS